MTKQSTKAEAFDAHRRGDLINAERLYNELLRRTPSDAELLHYMGVLCHQTGRVKESMAWLHRALALAPRSLPTLHLLVRACDETGDTAGAIRALDQYLALRPNDAGMLNVKGQLLVRLGHLHDAEQSFRKATEVNGSASMFHDLGVCRQLLGNNSGAAAAYRQAIRLGHTQPRTRLWLAQALRALGQTKDYYEAAMEAARYGPDDLGILTEAQSARRYVCDWPGFALNQPRMLASLRRSIETNDAQDIPPGIFNFLEVDERTISDLAKRYAGQISVTGADLNKKLQKRRSHHTHEKIRLGYLSSDFFAHAVGSLVRDLFTHHDRTQFEVYGYSLRHRADEIQSYIQQGCDTYRNLSGRNAEDIARAIHDDEIDILIDLAGYTSAGQPTVLATRPAPVQMAWLGYLGTTGGSFIDYIIADDIVLPPELAQHYTEHVIRMPCFLITSSMSTADEHFSRESMGFDKDDFVFCSFNQPYKLDHATFVAWMEILRHTPGSKLWLYAPDTEICTSNLRREAISLNIEPERLVFAQRAPLAIHMARIALADLALDPFHISGGATSAAILSAGVPILTLRGNSFLSRMGSSINCRLGMNEFDCATPEEYIAKAITLATTPPKLGAAKNHLKKLKTTHDFFNTKSFVSSLETAFQIAWNRHLSGQKPEDIRVSNSAPS